MAIVGIQDDNRDDPFNGGNTGIGNTGRGDPGPIVPAPGARDAARSAFGSALTSAGGQWNSDTEGDFENLFGQSAEAGQYSGAGYGKSFNDLLGAYQPTLQSRWGGSAGQAAPSQGSRGPSPSKQFSDPLSSFLEDWSNKYAQSLENPAQNSGRALFEKALEQISGQFRQGGFTPAENEVFQTQALDPLERLRTTRKQQVMEELSRRGIDPKSGVAQSMLMDVDRQFDSSRAQTQRSIAGQGAQETQQRMMQAVQLLSTLAGSQDQRMGQAFNYYSVPYNLSNNAFNQSMQFSQMNNPLSLVQPLLALSGQQQGRQDSQGAALADLIWALTRGAG